jgi:hypothetical protein
MTSQQECPFRVGDRVRFSPNAHASGWSWPRFDTVRLHPGDIGTVTRIEGDTYLYLDNGRGGFHWECFERL